MAGWRDLLGTTISSFKIGINKATLAASGLTAARTYTLPDVSGTVALTSDLTPSGGSDTFAQSKLSSGFAGAASIRHVTVAGSGDYANTDPRLMIGQPGAACGFSYQPGFVALTVVNEAGTGCGTLRANALQAETYLSSTYYLQVGNTLYAPSSAWDSPCGARVRSDGVFGFSSTTLATGSVDAAIQRDAAGITKTTDGFGSLRDHKLRSLLVAGSTSGVATISAPAVAGTPALTLPGTSGTLALTSQLGGVPNTFGASVINFGAFPGADMTSLVVTGQTGVASTSKVSAWLTAVDTADHSADEHIMSDLAVYAGNIVPGVSFTLYAVAGRSDATPVGSKLLGAYGLFNVNWSY